jgi:hypothetical protein
MDPDTLKAFIDLQEELTELQGDRDIVVAELTTLGELYDRHCQQAIDFAAEIDPDVVWSVEQALATPKPTATAGTNVGLAEIDSPTFKPVLETANNMPARAEISNRLLFPPVSFQDNLTLAHMEQLFLATALTDSEEHLWDESLEQYLSIFRQYRAEYENKPQESQAHRPLATHPSTVGYGDQEASKKTLEDLKNRRTHDTRSVHNTLDGFPTIAMNTEDSLMLPSTWKDPQRVSSRRSSS